MENIQNFWDYFSTVKNSDSIRCNICQQIYSKPFAPVHLYRSHHKSEQNVILKWNNDDHPIWQHFSKRDLFVAKCNYCDAIFSSAYTKHGLHYHLRAFHQPKIVEIQTEITRTWMSSYSTFDIEKCNIKCNKCTYTCKIYDGVDVLRHHLNSIHNLDNTSS